MNQVDPILKCRKCGKEISKFKQNAEQIYEGMHRLCFHFEYEHEGEPDESCADDSSCPNFKIKVYEKKLKEAGVDLQKVLEEEIKKGWNPD